jgi:hypothetical protein
MLKDHEGQPGLHRENSSQKFLKNQKFLTECQQEDGRYNYPYLINV